MKIVGFTPDWAKSMRKVARYYDPGVGRFVSEDPIKDSLNWYVYCGNNPINLIDPSGLAFIPLRSTTEKNGGTITWDGETRTATATMPNGNTVVYYEGDGKGTFINKVDGIMYVQDQTYYEDTMLTRKDKKAEVKIKIIDGIPYKDYTIPINKALMPVVGEASSKWGTTFDYLWFYNLVKGGGPWDIKLKSSWEKTIGVSFPGTGVKIYYNGMLMTPEEMGNYTYGYIGAAMNIRWDVLRYGSWHAAGKPNAGEDLLHEMTDWGAIAMGYRSYQAGN